MSDTRPTTGHVLTHLPILRRDDMSDYHYAAITYRGRVWVICTEGVGWEVTAETPWTPGDGREFSVARVLELLAAATADKPLETWIRSFGSRLESNFHTWERTLGMARDGKVEAECGDLVLPGEKDAHEAACRWCEDARRYAAEEAAEYAADLVASY
jgi:hypothetical protein